MSKEELLEKIDKLASDDYELIVTLVNKLSMKKVPFSKMSEDELVEELTASAKRSDEGHTKSARIVAEQMRSKYAV